MASGELISVIAMSEPGVGSDLRSMRTCARQEGDHYVINGQKTFITNGGNAGLMVTATKLDPPPPGALDNPGKPYFRRTSKTVYPPSFEKDSALYCQKLIGQWNLEEATMLLGESHGSRPAFDDRQLSGLDLRAWQFRASIARRTTNRPN